MRDAANNRAQSEMWAEPLVDHSSFFSVTKIPSIVPRYVSLFLERTSSRCYFHVPGQDMPCHECGLELAAHWVGEEGHLDKLPLDTSAGPSVQPYMHMCQP